MRLIQPSQPSTSQPSTNSTLNILSQLDNLFNLKIMYKYLLQSVDGIQWFGISTLLIFFGTFCVASIRTFISRKEEMQHMANLPLED
jgi:hypothetical protein